ncbi:MAG: hypothetical protein KGM47_13965, partial [Acidobacteriota bacterium]|nr:hypothetical protein [Acidobacteriota bacterium]
MKERSAIFAWVMPVLVAFACLNSAIPARAGARRASLGQQAAAAGAVVRSIGTVQSVEGKMIKLKTDS